MLRWERVREVAPAELQRQMDGGVEGLGIGMFAEWPPVR